MTYVNPSGQGDGGDVQSSLASLGSVMRIPKCMRLPSKLSPMTTLDDLLDQVKSYRKSIVHAHNLVAIHKALNQGAGRRHREVSLNRAVVVVSVASWQAFNQDVTLMLIEDMRPKKDEYEKAAFFRGAESDWRRRKAAVTEGVGRYQTPNAENTRKLLSLVGFDPWELWKWDEESSHGNRTRLDEWLKVRHAIAHGGPLPPVSVIGRKPKSREPTLRRKDAEECIEFFRQLTLHTILGVEID